MTPCYYCEADDDACKTCIHSDTYIDPQEEITKLREQVAAQAAVIEKLREAVRKAAYMVRENTLTPGGNPWALQEIEAMAHKTDSTQVLAEVRKQERERVAEFILRTNLGGIPKNWQGFAADGLFKYAEAIRAME